MADINLLAPFQGSAGSTIDYILWGILILVLAGATFGIMAGIRWLLKFDKRVILLYPYSGGFRRINDRAKLLKEKDGNTYWRFLKTKGIKNRALRVTPPDDIYIDINKRGKEVCMFEMIDVENPVPIHPKVKDPTKDVLKESTVSPDDRAAIIDDIERTKQLHNDKSFMQLVTQALPIIAVVVVVIMMVLFLDQFASTQGEIVNQVDKTLDSFEKVSQQQQDLMSELARSRNQEYIVEKPPE